MLKLLTRITLLPLVLFAILGSATPATAADGWLPNVRPATRVYLDPALENHANYPVRLDGLQEQLAKRSKTDGVEFYLVIAQKGSGQIPAPYGSEYAAWQLDELVSRNAGSFDPKRSVLIMVIRSDKNPNAFSVAANAGSELKTFGLNKAFFAGAFLKERRDKYLPNDVQGFVLAVADGVNQQQSTAIANEKAEVARQQAAAEAEKARQAFNAMLPIYLGIGFVLLAGLGIFLWRLFVYLGAAKRLKALLDEWGPKMDSVTTLYQQLTNPTTGYLDFITDQIGRREKFTGETRQLYDAKLKEWTAFTVRREVAARLFEAATNAYKGRRFLSSGALNAAHASLTTTTITITGKEKALKDITDAFGGILEKQDFQPTALMENINDLFNSVNTGFARIMSAFTEAEADKATITTTLKAVDALKTALKTAGLTFDPYQPRHEKIATEAARLLENISANPIGKLAESNRLEADVVDLKGDIEKCIAIKGALLQTVAAIATVRSRATQVRSQSSNLTAYPLIQGEVALGKGDAHFLLNENGHNPDGDLKSADGHVATCEKELLAGEWEKSQAAKEAAEASARSADATITTVLDAKMFVESHVTSARASLATLNGKLDDADTAVASLERQFLAANFTGQPEKLTTAKTVSGETEDNLSEVRTAYGEQRFIAARVKLESVESSVASADKGLAGIHTRLAALKEFRKHAKEQAIVVNTKSGDLKEKRKQKQFTTAAATDAAHRELVPSASTLHLDVQLEIADWPALASSADELVRKLAALDKQVDDQEAAFKDAQEKIGAVRTAVQAAAQAVAHEDVLQPAKSELQSARGELSTLETAVQVAKSDWSALAKKAASKKDVADKAKRLALQDVEAAGEARTAIAEAGKLISGNTGKAISKDKTIGGRHREFSESLDLSDASSKLTAARTALSNGQYSNAKNLAAQAKQEVTEAKQAADSAIDAAITAAVVAYNLTVQQSTPAPSSHRRSDDNNGSVSHSPSYTPPADTGFSGGNTDTGFSSNDSTGNSGGNTDSNF